MKLIQVLVEDNDENGEAFIQWLKENVPLNPHVKTNKIKFHIQTGNFSQ